MESSSEKKVLSINPDIFSASSFRNKKTRKNKSPSDTAAPRIIPNQTLKHLKKEAYRKIREHQKRIEAKMGGEPTSEEIPNLGKSDSLDDSDFKDSFKYLESLGKEMKQKKSSADASKQPVHSNTVLHHTIRQRQTPSATVSAAYSTVLPDVLEEAMLQPNATPTIHTTSYNIPMPEPAYGILKGGKKPTYRTWKNATSRTSSTSIHGQGGYLSSMPITEREIKLEQIKQKVKMNQTGGNVSTSFGGTTVGSTPTTTVDIYDSPDIPLNIQGSSFSEPFQSQKPPNPISSSVSKPTKRRKTYHRTFRVGKQKDGSNTVSVYVANRKTRRDWQTKLQQIKQTPIQEIKKELMQQKLLKAGATVPNDVVRVIYENSVLAGNLQNHNESVVLHNFLNEDKDK